MITWALRFVDDFSTDILAATTARHEYLNSFTNGRYGRNDGLLQEVEAYLHEQVLSGRPLPGIDGHPNLTFISIEVGSGRDGISRDPLLRAMVHAAATTVGVTDYTWLPVPILGRIDGRPWADGVAARHPTLSVDRLRLLLQASCYVVIAFLSGMRDAEIKHLRRGCLTVHRDPDGVAYRWKLTSRAFKGESDPAGSTATWVVGQSAARAVGVLETLQADNDMLFARLREDRTPRPGKRGPNRVLTTNSTNAQMNNFIDWINTYCTEHQRTDGIPLVNGKRWTLSTRQFRRTLAWFIARRPGGSIAGAIQYRHLSIQMFEGYAGTSDSGFRAEVEAEQALARGEHLLTIIDAHDHENLAGPAAGETHRRLDGFAERARFTGAVVTDQHRLKRLMRQHDPAIYPGKYATCVFNPDKALCLPRHDAGANSRPALDSCRPLDCGNAAFEPHNIAALRTEQDRLDEELAAAMELPPLLRHRLADRRDRIAAFLLTTITMKEQT